MLHEGRVVILISKRAENSHFEWTPISNKNITARFYTRYRRVTIIQVYEPHNDKKKRREKSVLLIITKTIAIRTTS